MLKNLSKQNGKSTTFYCFSPPVMLVTFIIEISLAIYTIVRYKLTKLTKLAIAILVCLSIFQLAEYMVCEGAFGLDSLSWARIGYVAITMLPPLGLHLGATISKSSHRELITAAYVSAIFFALVFALAGQGVNVHLCLGNYVIFEMARWAAFPYAIFYYGWLAFGLALAFLAAQNTKNVHRQKSLYALAIGYAAFIVPTTAANIADPTTLAGIPSIMCGFAVLLAIILAAKVLPEATKDISKK